MYTTDREYEDAIQKLNNSDDTSRAVPKYYEDPVPNVRLADELVRIASKVPEDAREEEKHELANYLMEEWFIRPLSKQTKKELMADPHYQFIIVTQRKWELEQGFRPSIVTTPDVDVRCGLFPRRLEDGSIDPSSYEVYTYIIDKVQKVVKVFTGLEEWYTVYYPTDLFWTNMEEGIPVTPAEACTLYYLDDVPDEYRLARARTVERLAAKLKPVIKNLIWRELFIRGVIFHMEAMIENDVEAMKKPYKFIDKNMRHHTVYFKPDGYEIDGEVIMTEDGSAPYSLDNKITQINEVLRSVCPECKTMMEESKKGVKYDLCNRRCSR